MAESTKSTNPDRKPYKSVYKPKNPQKYKGKHLPVCRSSWERQFARWCDVNPKVVAWMSESTVIPYTSKVDGKVHRYYIDFTVEFDSGKIVLFEIKPEKQTKPPERKTRSSKRFLNEVKTYATNVSKWEAAKMFAEAHNVTFQILTEKELKKLGLKII